MPTAFGNYTPAEVRTATRGAVLQERHRIAKAVVYAYILRGENFPLTWPMTFGSDVLQRAVTETVKEMRAKGIEPKGAYAKL